jgi:hypothetical protein
LVLVVLVDQIKEEVQVEINLYLVLVQLHQLVVVEDLEE